MTAPQTIFNRAVLVTVCVVSLLAAGTAYGQERATVTLRSGERVIGQLVDLGGGGYTMLVNGTERQVAQSDVAVIDFTGEAMTAADWTTFRGTPQVVLRSGETFDGALYDISGTLPLHLIIKTRDDVRELSASDVARIITSHPAIAVGTSGRIPRLQK